MCVCHFVGFVCSRTLLIRIIVINIDNTRRFFTEHGTEALRILNCLKVGAHEGTGRRDLLQGLIACRVYTVGPCCGDKSLEVFTVHEGTCCIVKHRSLGRFSVVEMKKECSEIVRPSNHKFNELSKK